jgi:hypothetical protein
MLWRKTAKTLYAKKGQYLFTMYLLTSNGQTDKELTLPTLLDLNMTNFNPWDHNQYEKETWKDYAWTAFCFSVLIAGILFIFI